MIRVLLVEDQAMVRGALSALLSLETDIEVLGSAADGENAWRDLQRLKPDILVTDIRMPGMSGLELSDIATRRRRDLGVVLVSGYFLPQPLFHRFLQKPFRTHELDAAIRAELSHRTHA